MHNFFYDMITRRASKRIEVDNVCQEVPPQALIDPLNVNVTNVGFRSYSRYLLKA